MATRTVKARVEIDGEKEYKAALADLNNGNRVLASEMRKLQAEYKDSAESTEFLTKKGELLERQLLQQKDKVAELRAAMENAARQSGESSAATQAWAVKLNDAEAAQFNLEHAIEENNKALQESQSELKSEGESLVSVGDTVDDLTGKFGIRLPDGLKKALGSFQGFSSGTVLAMTAAAAGVAALGKVVSELHEITKKTAADVDEILTESMVTGLSTQTIQELKYAENLIDVSYSTISSTLTKLTASMAKARDGNEELAASFSALGVEITDESGQLRDAESVFYDVIDALGQIQNPTERDAAAMELLGKSAQELNPLIAQGSQVLKDYAKQAQDTGYVLDESQLKKLGEVDDAYQQLQLTVDASKKQLASDFAPASKAAMEEFAKAVKAASDTLERSGIIKGVSEILVSLTALIEPLTEILGITPGLTSELQPLYQIFHAIAGVVAVIADTADAVIGLLTLNPTKFNTALGLNGKYGMYSHTQQWNTESAGYSGRLNYEGWVYDPSTGTYTGNYFTGQNASGNQNWRGGLTYLGEGGPEMAILPRGTQILNAQETRELGGDTFYITIDAASIREFNDIVEIARSARVKGRMK